MPRSHVRLQFGMWRKPGHADTPALARLLYVTILGDEAINYAGVVVLRPAVWAEDAGLTEGQCREALAELVARRFVVVDERTCELLVRTFIRNDGVAEQPNILRSALESALLVRSAALRGALAQELRQLPGPLPPKPTKSGRMFFYPDPHATADDLAPVGEVVGETTDRNPSQIPSPKGSGNPSPDLWITPDSEPFAEPFPEDSGVGEGVGEGGISPSVGGPVGGSRAHTREAAPGSSADAPPPPGPTPNRNPAQPAAAEASAIPGLLVVVAGGVPDVPPRCTRCAKLPPEVDQPCWGCGRLRKAWLADVAAREETRAAQQQADEARRTEVLAAVGDCVWCDEHRWRLVHPGGPLAVPARRCDHQPDDVVVPDLRKVGV